MGLGEKPKTFSGRKLDPKLSGRERCKGGLGAETAELGTDRSRVAQRRTKWMQAVALSAVCEWE